MLDARALLALCVGGLIDKRRHLVTYQGHVWEVDEFLGDNAGLIVAEIELERPDEAFATPEWVGTEVTDDVRYYNLALASHPFNQWGGRGVSHKGRHAARCLGGRRRELGLVIRKNRSVRGNGPLCSA